jgi:hypothetical protein
VPLEARAIRLVPVVVGIKTFRGSKVDVRKMENPHRFVLKTPRGINEG